jgi:glycosyltransferase involved in cell wall biosynthesis
MKQLSIIVPVYQVEQYIRPCMESLFRQGLDDDAFEVIVVNDGTRDRSMDVIADFIASHQNIVVVNQENQGLSMARNNGMKHATGEYIAFVDSDDLLEDHALKTLMEQAEGLHPDLIVADYQKMDDEAIEVRGERLDVRGERLDVRGERLDVRGESIEFRDESLEFSVKCGTQLLLEDLNPRACYVWRTLYRRAFLTDHHISFIPGITFEDTPFTHECYLKAGTCLRSNTLLYIYRIGHVSITTGIDRRKATDFSTAIIKTWELSRLDGLAPDIRHRLMDNIYIAFSVLIYGIADSPLDHKERGEIAMAVREKISGITFGNSMRQKVLMTLFNAMPKFYVGLKTLYQRHQKH